QDAARPLLAQASRRELGGGGVDALGGGERGGDVASDRVVVAAGAGGSQPPREVPAARPAPVDRAAVVRESHRPVSAAGSRTLRPALSGPTAPRSPCRRSAGTWPRPCRRRRRRARRS